MKTLDKTDLSEFAKQIAHGMKYLEQEKFVHRDLAARNVLVDGKLNIKICDFGLTRTMKEDDIYKSTDSPFPYKWTAPEALEYRNFTHKSDVWSFGIVLNEIYTLGKEPYPGVAACEILDMLRHGYRMPRPELAGSEMYDMMIRCWDLKPERRPDFAEIYEFMKEMYEVDYPHFSSSEDTNLSK